MIILNNTNYRNQINKVANAIKEVISGLKTEQVEPAKEKINCTVNHWRKSRKKRNNHLRRNPLS